MFFTIYKTTNLVNQKYYYGKHICNMLNDSYLGSGKALRSAIKKYGRNSFKKEVLFVFDDKKSMDLKEKEILSSELIKNENCYNMKPGGEGGSFKGVNKNTKWINNGVLNKKITISENIPEGWCFGLISKRTQKPSGGKKSKGKIWITNGVENTMIFPNHTIPEGWYKGRNKAFSENKDKFKNGGKCTKGKIWINNGITNKRIDSKYKLETGWNRGRIKCN